MKKILLIFFLIICTLSCSTKKQEVYILSENYIGYVIIIFEQEKGHKLEYKGKKRVYSIPSTGILKTKFEPNYGWSGFPEFFYGTIKKENKIRYVYEFEKVPDNEVVCFGGTSGTQNINNEGTHSIKFVEYYIGNKKQIIDAIEKAQALDYEKLVKPDHW